MKKDSGSIRKTIISFLANLIMNDYTSKITSSDIYWELRRNYLTEGEGNRLWSAVQIRSSLTSLVNQVKIVEKIYEDNTFFYRLPLTPSAEQQAKLWYDFGVTRYWEKQEFQSQQQHPDPVVDGEKGNMKRLRIACEVFDISFEQMKERLLNKIDYSLIKECFDEYVKENM
jgi:hypothetical protein